MHIGIKANIQETFVFIGDKACFAIEKHIPFQ
jgi:hypothetical protein